MKRVFVALVFVALGLTLPLGLNCLPNIGSYLPQCHQTPEGLICENFEILCGPQGS